MSSNEGAAKIAAEAIEERWADEGLRLEELSDPEADAWTAIEALIAAGYRITFIGEGDR